MSATKHKLKNLLAAVPGALPLATGLISKLAHFRRFFFRRRATIFKEIFENNEWGDKDSVSGQGSNLQQTEVVRRELVKLLADYQIESLLDIPCGDFFWMKELDLADVNYIGADIVEQIVAQNQQFARPNRTFTTLDLTEDALPKVDLVMVRDCCVHLSFRDIKKALKNICNSGSTYLLTTTFPDNAVNEDIYTGQWRALNLEAAPLFLPPPIHVFSEQHQLPEFRDKSLALWRIDELRAVIH